SRLARPLITQRIAWFFPPAIAALRSTDSIEVEWLRRASRRKAMALEIRRIVTGHDSQGKAVVATDERLGGTGAAGRPGISRVDVWSTDKMPIDNSDAAAELQRKGFVVRHNYVGSGQGSVCRVVEFAPGGAKFMHRTETLDYAICLK